MGGLEKFFICLVTVNLLCAGASARESKNPQYRLDLGEVVITPSKVEGLYQYSTQNISVISREDIESTGATQVGDLLETLPSLDVLDYGSLGSQRSVQTRGMSAKQVLTLIDGRPVNTPRDGLTDFNKLPISNIERIEVLRGPASSIYGSSALGGVINIITKKGEEDDPVRITSKFGSFNTRMNTVSLGSKVNKFDYFISHEYVSSHGHRDNSDYLSNKGTVKAGCQINEDNYLVVSNAYYDARVGSPGFVVNEDLNNRQESISHYTDISYSGKILDENRLLIKLYNNSDRLEFTEEFEPLNRETHHVKTYGFDSQLTRTIFDRFRTSIGFTAQENRLNSSNSGKHTYTVKGAYFESETSFSDYDILKLGVRWDDYTNFGDKISPSASCGFWVYDIAKLHLLAAKSFRAPTFNDLYWPREDWGIWGGVEGNTNLGPEKAVSFEAGVTGYFLDSLTTDLTLFRTNLKDLIDWTADNNLWYRPENISSAKIQGLEFETEFVITEYLKTNFNYTYIEAINKSTKKWLTYRPRHLYKLRLLFSPVPGYQIGLGAIYKSKIFIDTANTEFLKHYFLTNLDFIYKVNGQLSLFFEVKNLFDANYKEQLHYPMPPRAFYGGMRLSF